MAQQTDQVSKNCTCCHLQQGWCSRSCPGTRAWHVYPGIIHSVADNNNLRAEKSALELLHFTGLYMKENWSQCEFAVVFWMANSMNPRAAGTSPLEPAVIGEGGTGEGNWLGTNTSSIPV